MAKLISTVACTAGGTTLVTLNLEQKRSGSSNDNAAFRIVRRGNGQADYVLPQAPQLVLSSDRDMRSWTFIDVNVPVSGVYDYVAQIRRLDGGGTFYAMGIIGVHFRR